MRLFLEQELLIACDTLREVIRLLIGNVEGLYGKRINTTQRSGHRFGLCTKEVHVRIIDGLVPSGGDSVHVDLSSLTLILVAIGAYDLSPEPACCTELSQLHEVVGSDAEDELDTRGKLLD